MHRVLDRRRFVRLAASLGTAALWPRASAAAEARTRLILLGTGGGPTPKADVSAPAQVIVAGGQLYVVDCGDGVARQLVRAGLSLSRLRHVFITHQHSDHTADYGNLVWLAWASELATRVDTWGPPPLVRMTALFLEMNAEDIRVRMEDSGRPPLAPLIHPHEFSTAGLVMEDEHVRVTAALVEHPLVVPAFAYRFDAPDRSIVISGDTAPCEALVTLARGADVLVHEALWLPAVDRIAARETNAPGLRKHLLASHTAAEDCGRIAAAAGVKTLVLSHLVPGGDASITEEMWRDAAGRHFEGRIVVARDLMEV
jgi:ribonuclease BN (tRNA processing enzyme)